MPIIRNPFRKSSADFYHHGDATVADPNADLTRTQDYTHYPRHSGVFNSLSSKPVKVPAQGTDKQPAEYQLCEINDSGVFLPPTPPERPSFWQSSRSTTSRSSSYRSASIVDENEPFSISRESFDSYRRSFDICARSPVTLDTSSSPRVRRSVDFRQTRYPVSDASVTSPAMPRMSPPRLPDMSQAPLKDSFFNPPTSLEEDIDGEREENNHPSHNTAEQSIFEDVGLNDDKKVLKKRGFFGSHFGNSSSSPNNTAPQSDNSAQPTSSVSGGHAHTHSLGSLFARKRGASGQGAELGRIRSQEKLSNSPLGTSTSTQATVVVTSQAAPTAPAAASS